MVQVASSLRPWLLRGGIALIALTALTAGWHLLHPTGLPAGFASSNGRIEAVEIDIATKASGRLREILVQEGDIVTPGQELARMDAAVLTAQLHEAQANLQRAGIGIDTALSLVTQRQAERDAALAAIAQREVELDAADKRWTRTLELTTSGTASLQKRDDDRAAVEGAKAALAVARANLAAADAAIGNAQSQVVAAKAAVAATEATIQRIQADLDDCILRAPRDGRIQYRVAQPGEVLSAGGVVLNLVDVTDVYMTFFLSTVPVGQLAIGAEARIVLDAAPQYVLPASVTFVADVAQFTPKSVETADERQKLTFRVKAGIPPDLLRRYSRNVKTGLPGVAYVRLDAHAEWPANLQVRLPAHD